MNRLDGRCWHTRRRKTADTCGECLTSPKSEVTYVDVTIITKPGPGWRPASRPGPHHRASSSSCTPFVSLHRRGLALMVTTFVGVQPIATWNSAAADATAPHGRGQQRRLQSRPRERLVLASFFFRDCFVYYAVSISLSHTALGRRLMMACRIDYSRSSGASCSSRLFS